MSDNVIFTDFTGGRTPLLDENQSLDAKNEWVRKAEKAFTHLFTNGGDYDRKYGAEVIFHALYMACEELPTDANLGRMIAMINNIDRNIGGDLPLPDRTDCRCITCKRETLSKITGVWGCDCETHGNAGV